MTITSADKDVEYLKFLSMACENGKWYKHIQEEGSRQTLRLNVNLPYNVAIPFLAICPNKNKNIGSHKNHNSSIYIALPSNNMRQTHEPHTPVWVHPQSFLLEGA